MLARVMTNVLTNNSLDPITEGRRQSDGCRSSRSCSPDYYLGRCRELFLPLDMFGTI